MTESSRSAPVAGQRRPIRALHLEDDSRDAELVADCLREAGANCETVRVETQADFEEAVRNGDFDVIFSDYTLPAYDGASALAFAKRVRPEIPFILVSGTVGEDAAVSSLLGGAVDYVLKARLSRLFPALQRALSEAENRCARRRAEAALHASEYRYRRLFETTKDGIILLDASTGKIVDANPSLVEMLGHPLDKLVGKTCAEVGFSGDDPTTEAALQELTSRGDGHHPGLRLSAAGGRLVEVELVARAYAVDSTNIVQLNMRDITERRRLEEELRQSQKLEALGRLAGGVAHDFNNLLVVINSYTELAMGSLTRQEPLYDDIEEVHKAGLRAAKLTNQLLAFSRKQQMRPVVCSLNLIVAELERMLHRVIGEHIDLRLRLTPDLGKVVADPGQIEQVIVNLAVNARDAMEQGGALVIETGNAELGPAYANDRADVTPGSYVRLSVSDAGCGMDALTMARMFEPFFTTKAHDKGTGLGLSTVYGIVKQSGGHIDVESRLGKGTCVNVYLPRRDDGVADAPVPERSAEPRSQAAETILCVEDEAAVRRVVERVLTALGYHVLVASSADEVMALVRHDEPTIDLLLTDVVLPGVNGYELARALAAARPSMKIMFMSGYSPEPAPDHSGATLLQKPFSVADLVRRVREALAGPRPPTP